MSEPFFYVIGQIGYSFGQIRYARNQCLQLTDFIMSTDNPLDELKKTELINYRQELRDITTYPTADEAANNFPTHPDWLSDWVRIPE